MGEKMKIGDPFNEDTTVGATICKEHAEKVLGYVQSAIDEGAKVECGGKRVLLEGELSDGHYLSPCILTNCHDKMKAVQEEIFGSVAIILPFDTEEEVLKRANDTTFGLGGGVFTKDFGKVTELVLVWKLDPFGLILLIWLLQKYLLEASRCLVLEEKMVWQLLNILLKQKLFMWR